MSKPSRSEILHSAIQAGIPTEAAWAIDDFVVRVDMDLSGSGISHLGENDFAIYDYPPAEDWLRRDCVWPHHLVRLGDGTFHFVTFEQTKGAVEFKLRWGLEVIERKVNA